MLVEYGIGGVEDLGMVGGCIGMLGRYGLCLDRCVCFGRGGCVMLGVCRGCCWGLCRVGEFSVVLVWWLVMVKFLVFD